MTDSWLMDTDCVHGRTWSECAECDELLRHDPVLNSLEDVL